MIEHSASALMVAEGKKASLDIGGTQHPVVDRHALDPPSPAAVTKGQWQIPPVIETALRVGAVHRSSPSR